MIYFYNISSNMRYQQRNLIYKNAKKSPQIFEMVLLLHRQQQRRLLGAGFRLDFRVTEINLEGCDAFMTRNCSNLLSCATHISY